MKKFHRYLLPFLALFTLLACGACKKQPIITLSESYLTGDWTLEAHSKVTEAGQTITIRGNATSTFGKDGILHNKGQLSIKSGKKQIAQLKYKDISSWSIQDGSLVLVLQQFTSSDHTSDILSQQELAEFDAEAISEIDQSDTFKVTSIKPNELKLESTKEGTLVTAIYTRVLNQP